MDEFEKMAIAQLKVIIASEPCAVGKCHTNPRYEYAKRLWNGEGIVQDKKEAFLYFKEAADFRHEGAQYKVGCCYYKGDGIPQDFEKALKYFKRLLQTNHDWSLIANLWICLLYTSDAADEL